MGQSSELFLENGERVRGAGTGGGERVPEPFIRPGNKI